MRWLQVAAATANSMLLTSFLTAAYDALCSTVYSSGISGPTADQLNKEKALESLTSGDYSDKAS